MTKPNTPEREAEIVRQDFHTAKVENNPMIWKPALRSAMSAALIH